MSIDDVWNTAGNTPSPSARASLISRTHAEVRRARRRRIGFVAATSLALLVTSGLIIFAWASRADVAGAMPAAGLVLAQWVALAFFVRDLLSDRRGGPLSPSVRESLEALWRELEMRRRRQSTVLMLYAVAVPLLCAALWQLRMAGKMAPHEALSAALVFAGVILAGTTFLLLSRRLILDPRRRRLAALLDEYREDSLRQP